MRLALAQARRARGRTSPNPLVGAVLAKDGQIIACGYHQKAGTPHAEINALTQAGAQAAGATLYLTLEPCSHHGRTPPCCEAVAASGVVRVVAGMTDPNPLVAGRGLRYLAERGIEATVGVLEKECRELNLSFCRWITSGLPWVILKAGLSLDGRIAVKSGRPGWITGEASRRRVHRLRDEVDAILVGIGTALADDPALTTRLPGRGHRDPLRVVLDRELRLPVAARMLNQESTASTLVFCGPGADPARREALERAGALIAGVGLGADGQLDLPAVLAELGRRQVTSLLVEGGSRVLTSFWRQGLAQQVMLFYGPLFLGGDGLPFIGPLGLGGVERARRLREVRCRRIDDDVLIEGLV